MLAEEHLIYRMYSCSLTYTGAGSSPTSQQMFYNFYIPCTTYLLINRLPTKEELSHLLWNVGFFSIGVWKIKKGKKKFSTSPLRKAVSHLWKCGVKYNDFQSNFPKTASDVQSNLSSFINIILLIIWLSKTIKLYKNKSSKQLDNQNTV